MFSSECFFISRNQLGLNTFLSPYWITVYRDRCGNKYTSPGNFLVCIIPGDQAWWLTVFIILINYNDHVCYVSCVVCWINQKKKNYKNVMPQLFIRVGIIFILTLASVILPTGTTVEIRFCHWTYFQCFYPWWQAWWLPIFSIWWCYLYFFTE